MVNLENIEATNFIEEEIIADLKSGRSKEVITRCPPEPSGYFHIGHCKAWVIDFETALKFGGYTYLRLDDTNPTKEEGEFAESYAEDLKWLGYTPKAIIYASETYSEAIYNMAEQAIRDGLAYIDEEPQEVQLAKKGTLTEAGVESPFRNRPFEESLKLFREMREGKHEEGTLTLRAKIDMAHPNILMRDPIIYRIVKSVKHYRTGDKWCIYPMYDFAHPLQDALEGVTYSMCDYESFRVHRPLYEWVIDNIWKKPYGPKQREFSRFNLENVLLGKRYLKQIVKSGKVMGWDDPRFMTIVGMRRKGYTAEGIKNFVKSLGVTISPSTIPFSALEFHIREDLNKVATRAMVVLDPLKVVITNYDGEEDVDVQNNPNLENAGSHKTKFSKEIYIEKEDFSLNPPPKYNRLVEGGVVRLKGAYIIKCNKVVFKENGEIDHLECEYFPESKSGNDNSGIKCKGTIHYVSSLDCFPITIRNFKNLTKMEYLWPQKEIENGKTLDDILEEDSMWETKALAENFLKTAKVEDKFQFMRKGYYCLDKDSTADNLIFNHTISLKDGFKK